MKVFIILSLMILDFAYAVDYGDDLQMTFTQPSIRDVYDYSEPRENAMGKKIFKVPYREISIIVTDDGFFPKSFSVFKGEKIRFFITNTSLQASCFFISEKNIFLAANRGSITEATAIFTEKGKHKFYCPSSKISGHLTVIEKVSDARRKIANYDENKKARVWKPRDY